MSAAIDIIHGSLYKIGVHSEIKPVSNEMLSFSFRKFQSFIKSLRDRGYDKTGAIVPASTADEVSERGGVTAILETLFAEYITNYFNKPPTAELLRMSSLAWDDMNRYYRTLEIPDLVPNSARIRGSGNW